MVRRRKTENKSESYVEERNRKTSNVAYRRGVKVVRKTGKKQIKAKNGALEKVESVKVVHEAKTKRVGEKKCYQRKSKRNEWRKNAKKNGKSEKNSIRHHLT